MLIFGVVFVLMLIAVGGMAVGVLAGRKSLQGSCGGLNTIQGLDCMVCPTPCESEEEKKADCPHAQKNVQSEQHGSLQMIDEASLNRKVISSTASETEGVPCN